MCVNHVLCETGNTLSTWFAEFVFDVIDTSIHGVFEVVRFCSLTLGRNPLVVILNLVDFHQIFVQVLVAQIREKLLDMRQLRNRHLIVKFLCIWVMIHIIRSIGGQEAVRTSGHFIEAALFEHRELVSACIAQSNRGLYLDLLIFAICL